MSGIQYRRILLKLSGEALMGDGDFGIDPAIVGRLAREIAELVQAGVEVGLVIGGGNLFRGAGLAQGGLDRVRGDHMGMLATVMNSLAMQDALEKLAVPAQTFSAIPMETVCESYSRRRADAWLRSGGVALLAAGTGNPFFTTDSAAGLRAIEIGAELLIKATKVDGVYSADPVKNPDAQFYPQLTYDQALAERLAVMDTAAIVLCRDHGLPMRIMNIYEAGAILRAVQGQSVGSLVHSGVA